MKIELKKIKVNLAFSQETTMFDADIYIDDVKVGYADNQGFGGATNISGIGSGAERDRNYEMLDKANDFCKTLPSETYEYEKGGDMHTMIFNQNLETFIDNLVQDYIEGKQAKRFQNKLKKDMEKFVCYSKSNKVDGCKEYHTLRFTNYRSLEEIFSTPRLKEKVESMMSELKAEGFHILNTNLGGV
jgi:hypothetical protein